MEIQGSRVLLLGGSGLVGRAIARRIMPLRPRSIAVSGLTREEAEAAVSELRSAAEAHAVELTAEWGDLFLPAGLKDRRRREVLDDESSRTLLLDELYAPADEEALERSGVGDLLLRVRPDVIVDCINTATVFAYQNVFASAASLRRSALDRGSASRDEVEKHLATLYLPQLIRHVQLLMEAMRRVGTRVYVKIGTAGTGGMGLNIPFTHSEERPSRMLLAKSSVAGAHTLLLFLMARTPGAPAVKEVKPTAAISWKRIEYGTVNRGGRPISRVDSTRPLTLAEAFAEESPPEPAWTDSGEPLRGVFLDAGENGLFSPGEFETLTALGLMEFITPEEIARDVVREIQGHPTGRDVVAALDASTSGPTYRAGVLRQQALDRMDQLEAANGVQSVAYEMLGPPRLSKLLFEAAILGRLTGGTLAGIPDADAADLAREADALIERDADLRSRILSIGLPVLLSDGEHVLRGAEVKVAPDRDHAAGSASLVDNGWVDLRESSWTRWQARVRSMLEESGGAEAADYGSVRDIEAWERSGTLRPGALAAWVFRHEDRGERVKR